MRYYRRIILSLLCGLASLHMVHADTLTVELELPVIRTPQYEAPFVAVWLEQKGQRRALQTLSVWYNDKKWLKDLRRWWRKAGRYGEENFDAVSSASRVAGRYKERWELTDIAAGDYILYLEAAREHGDRTVLKQPIRFGAAQAQQFELVGGKEIGAVSIQIKPTQVTQSTTEAQVQPQPVQE
ncbi:DUF2271 domain-containing protein [Candidatus Albibeggiatoa sp. nov. NOAA]|uniref:DUF2271 domain-containing protein n=1 Tax=Candidatus Albibeggiatoa sp. nov. NOAA TaxID=3162724 RepID=UPI0033002D2B|nr:DUF2271 domain-containing protein [Thiotrichaceae bacterium]